MVTFSRWAAPNKRSKRAAPPSSDTEQNDSSSESEDSGV